MNKKVSTIFAMAALMGGSLFSSAYAQELDSFIDDTELSKIDLSKQYFIKVGEGYLYSEVDAANNSVTYFVKDVTTVIDKKDVKKYLWTLSQNKQGSGNFAYEITNAESGELLRVDVGNLTTFNKTNSNATGYNDAATLFYFSDESGRETSITADEGYKAGEVFVADRNLVVLDDAETVDLEFAEDGEEVTGTTITLQNVAPGISIDVTDLNDLYNSAGFNFALNNNNLSGVANIFGDKRVVALNVQNDAFNSDDNGFPAGTYFAVSTPRTWDYKYDGNGNPTQYPDYDYLTQCTFIAIDSDENILDDADQQKGGNGFTLTEVSGRDLVVYQGDDDDFKAQGDQIAVSNACFTVLESTTSENVYALSVEKARYKEAANADKQVETRVYITAGAKIAEIYTQASADANDFIFKFAESSAVKPSALLFNGDTAAIYNIQLYKANGADDTRNGKYLTSTPSGKFVAKGLVLADPATPAYQWVISAVNGSNVTFTNRETKATLTTQLFDEGNGVYSLSKTEVATEPEEYTYYVVNEKGDVVEGNENGNGATFSFDYTAGTRIQLIPVKAVNYAGYLNVEDETLMTLSFGRDIAPTSNKLYPYVTVNDASYTFEKEKSLTNKVSDAAQWLLVKNPKGATTAKYNYVYANGNLINTKNNGDVVYANSYGFQLVLDGKVIKDNNGNPYYLDITGATPTVSTTPGYYFIQENVDGSVAIMKSRANATALLLTSYDKDLSNTEDQSINALIKESFKLQNIEVESEATNVKTFLIAEAPAVSLPAVEGHYSFVSEMGNYITMNEDRDGLTVKEESEPLYLYVTDEEEVVPSFYITKGVSPVEGQRMYLFNPADSVDYYVATGTYDKKYKWADDVTKAIFKSAAISESRDTLTTEIKGKSTLVAQEASNAEKVEGGLDMFKMQILEDPEADGLYVVRNVADKSQYLYSWNGMLGWSGKADAMKFEITGAAAPTANESVSATEVKVIATDGAINIKNAAGKNVVISTILGQIVANEVLTSDNATISVPAGIAIVSVDGEEAVKVSVR